MPVEYTKRGYKKAYNEDGTLAYKVLVEETPDELVEPGDE